jgi:polysaccharide pyruvyl transferase WcaK-like protein
MCHGDDAVLHDSRLQSSAATCVLTPDLLVDMLALLATARFYVGSSLHGAIASLSYGNRAVVVADEGLSRLCKFSGFLAQVNLSDCLYASWKDAYDGLVSRGTDIFGGVTDSTTRALARRRNTWKDIDVSLRAAPRSRADLALDQSLESWVRDHYAV